MSITDKVQDYQVGQEAFYHESGEVYRVQVLEATGNREWERYKLKILKIVKESPMFVSSKVGEEFDCEKLRDSGGMSGLWHLLEH